MHENKYLQSYSSIQDVSNEKDTSRNPQHIVTGPRRLPTLIKPTKITHYPTQQYITGRKFWKLEPKPQLKWRSIWTLFWLVLIFGTHNRICRLEKIELSAYKLQKK